MIKRLSIILMGFLIVGCGNKTTTGDSAANAPETATLLLPVKDEVCTTGTVESATESTINFQWNAAKNADSYEVVFTNLITQTQVNQTVSSTQVNAKLLRNTPYSWYVVSKSTTSTTTAKSDTWKFYNAGAGIESYAPYPAELLTPAFGEVIKTSTGKINLTWKGSSIDNKIAFYNVFFGTSSNPPLVKAQTTDSFVNDLSVTPGSIYYWSVITVDKNGNVSISPVANFFVE